MSNNNNDNSHNKKEISDTTKMLHDKILLSFILVLGVIAVFIWTIFLIQISNIAEQTKILEEEHIEGSEEARDNVIKSKEASSLNVQMTKTNKKNIDNILRNITEINQKLTNLTTTTILR